MRLGGALCEACARRARRTASKWQSRGLCIGKHLQLGAVILAEVTLLGLPFPSLGTHGLAFEVGNHAGSGFDCSSCGPPDLGFGRSGAALLRELHAIARLPQLHGGALPLHGAFVGQLPLLHQSSWLRCWRRRREARERYTPKGIACEGGPLAQVMARLGCRHCPACVGACWHALAWEEPGRGRLSAHAVQTR